MCCGLPVCAWSPRRSARELDELLFRLGAMISLVRYLMLTSAAARRERLDRTRRSPRPTGDRSPRWT